MQINNIKPYAYNSPNFNGRIINKANASKALVYISGAALATSTLTAMTEPSRLLPCVFSSAILLNFLALARDLITEKPIQLEPQIEFKKSETIEEAAEFAKKNFKIKSFNVKDLEIGNWINEGLTVLNNYFKGKVYMPAHIEERRLSDAMGYYRPLTDTLTISSIDKGELYTKFAMMRSKIFESNELNLGTGYKKFKEDYKNFDNLSKIEKQNVVSSMEKIIEVVEQLVQKEGNEINLSEILNLNVKDPFGHIYNGRFSILFHEMGHVFDLKSRKDFEFLRSKIFKKERDNLVLPLYHKKNWKEFIVETFAGILEGAEYPQKHMDLFHKLCNIELPEN